MNVLWKMERDWMGLNPLELASRANPTTYEEERKSANSERDRYLIVAMKEDTLFFFFFFFFDPGIEHLSVRTIWAFFDNISINGDIPSIWDVNAPTILSI
jgi:hypothetical protein